MSINLLLSNLQKVKKRGNNCWLACCPAHDDSDPSLAIRLVDDGRILIKCFAGCSTLDVVHAVGMEIKDLFPAVDQHQYRPFAFALKERGEFQEKTSKLDHERLVLQIAASDRKAGKRLSQADLNRERAAYLAIRGARA